MAGSGRLRRRAIGAAVPRVLRHEGGGPMNDRPDAEVLRYLRRIETRLRRLERNLSPPTERRPMIVYELSPIDNWSGWQKPEAVFRLEIDDPTVHDTTDWLPLWEKAKTLAGRLGWEGDIREGPFVTVIPEDGLGGGPSAVVIAWKQNSNGTTFVASPYHLSWLEAHEVRCVEG